MKGSVYNMFIMQIAEAAGNLIDLARLIIVLFFGVTGAET